MKLKTRLFTVALVALILLSVTAQAHSGKTDSKGGHHVSSTGEYHYHHGYPAHDHDNGICPYESSSKNTTTKSTPKPTSAPTTPKPTPNPAYVITPGPVPTPIKITYADELSEQTNPAQPKQEQNNVVPGLIFVGLIVLMLSFYLYKFVTAFIEPTKKKNKKSNIAADQVICSYCGYTFSATEFRCPACKRINTQRELKPTSTTCVLPNAENVKEINTTPLPAKPKNTVNVTTNTEISLLLLDLSAQEQKQVRDYILFIISQR